MKASADSRKSKHLNAASESRIHRKIIYDNLGQYTQLSNHIFIRWTNSIHVHFPNKFNKYHTWNSKWKKWQISRLLAEKIDRNAICILRRRALRVRRTFVRDGMRIRGSCKNCTGMMSANFDRVDPIAQFLWKKMLSMAVGRRKPRVRNEPFTPIFARDWGRTRSFVRGGVPAFWLCFFLVFRAMSGCVRDFESDKAVCA